MFIDCINWWILTTLFYSTFPIHPIPSVGSTTGGHYRWRTISTRKRQKRVRLSPDHTRWWSYTTSIVIHIKGSDPLCSVTSKRKPESKWNQKKRTPSVGDTTLLWVRRGPFPDASLFGYSWFDGTLTYSMKCSSRRSGSVQNSTDVGIGYRLMLKYSLEFGVVRRGFKNQVTFTLSVTY